MPTKTEQADLNMALYGRHGEAPLAVIAPKSPAAADVCAATITPAAGLEQMAAQE